MIIADSRPFSFARHASQPRFWRSVLGSLQDRNYECILKTKNLLKFSTKTCSEPYFCLDTSLNRTLAYAHRCNGGKVLDSISICSHSRFAGEIVSALCATILHRTSPSLKRSGPAHDLDPIAGGNFVSPPHQKQRRWHYFGREAVRPNMILWF